MIFKRWCHLTSVMYIGPKSRTERPRKTKIGAQVAHVTRDSDTTFKVKRSNVKVTRPLCSPPASGGCSGERGNVLAVGCCYIAICSVAQGALVPTGERRVSISWQPAYSLLCSRPLCAGIKQWCCLTSVAYIVKIHGAHSYWKQGTRGAAGQA